MGSIFLADIDDYISPSQACVNPIFSSQRPTNSQSSSTTVLLEESKFVDDSAGTSVESTSVSFRAPTYKDETLIEPQKRVSRRRLRTTLIQSEESHPNGATTPIDSMMAIPSTEVEKSTKATVSVADCLACSGCVTTAETVLVSQHSLDKLRIMCSSSQHNNNQAALETAQGMKTIFTISRAAFVDLARTVIPDHCSDNHHICTLFRKLATFLQLQFNAIMLIDGTIPLELSLIHSAMEFCQRYRYVVEAQSCKDEQSMNNTVKSDVPNNNGISLTTPSIALSSTETKFIVPVHSFSQDIDGQSSLLKGNAQSSSKAVIIQHPPGIDERLAFLRDEQDVESGLKETYDTLAIPMLSSSCPGFVCYIEKTMPTFVPNLCTVKSPMAMAGCLVKHSYPGSVIHQEMLLRMKNDEQILHVAIMPCHDKKLEAGRKDLAYENVLNDNNALVPDIDIVITTSELLESLVDASLHVDASDRFEQKTCDNTDNGTEDQFSPLHKVRVFLQSLDLAPSRCIHFPCTDSSSGPYKSSIVALISSHMQFDSTNMDNSSRHVDENSTGISFTGSGGYAEFTFRFAARELFGCEIPSSEVLPWKTISAKSSVRRFRPEVGGILRRELVTTGNNSGSSAAWDFCEVSLYRHSNGTFSHQLQSDETDVTVLTCVTTYGFKNIQSLLQKLSKQGSKGKSATYHFVEAMACPSGCLNGGGQARQRMKHLVNDGGGASFSVKKKEAPSETRQRMRENQSILNRLWSDDILNVSCPQKNAGNDKVEFYHTRFHVVPKTEIASGAASGVAVSDVKW